MCWVIVYLMICYVIATCYDSTQALKAANESEARQLSRVQGGDSVSLWQKRYDAERKVFEQNRSRCWNAPSKEIASADVQTLLQKMAIEYELNDPRLTIGEPEPGVFDGENAWRVSAQIRGRINSGLLPPLINMLEADEAFFAVTRLEYLQKRSGTLNLFVSACFLEES